MPTTLEIEEETTEVRECNQPMLPDSDVFVLEYERNPEFGRQRPLRESELQQIGRLILVGGGFTVALGSVAINVYHVAAPEAAAAVTTWLMLLYFMSRAMVHFISTRMEPIERRKLVFPKWILWVSGLIMAGLVCVFLASVTAIAAACYVALSLAWAIEPTLMIAGGIAGTGIALLLAGCGFACVRLRVLEVLVLVVEVELAKMADVISSLGGRGSFAHAHTGYRRR